MHLRGFDPLGPFPYWVSNDRSVASKELSVNDFPRLSNFLNRFVFNSQKVFQIEKTGPSVAGWVQSKLQILREAVIKNGSLAHWTYGR